MRQPAGVFAKAGYATAAPEWPDDPETTEEAKAHPEVFANKAIGQIADHYQKVIEALEKKPAIIGHSFGGLLTEILAGRGLAAVSVQSSTGCNSPLADRRRRASLIVTSNKPFNAWVRSAATRSPPPR